MGKTTHPSTMYQPALLGCLLGTAVGDALGLPREGLSPQRALRRFGRADRYHFLGNLGFVSDDTDHTCLSARALHRAQGDPDRFGRELANGLRVWLLTIPPGIGFATLRACLKLCLGTGPDRSGVFSAGNGPAMRAAVPGICGSDEKHVAALVRTSTRITHTDPKAFHAAHTIALAARIASRSRSVSTEIFRQYLHEHAENGAQEVLALVDSALNARNDSTVDFARSLGLERGITGYALHTVSVCIHAWMSNQGDWLRTVRAAIECGGDADTTGAIAGAIAGAQLGPESIPLMLKERLVSWPYTIAWMEQAAAALAYANDAPLSLGYARLLMRNVASTCIVFAHVFRRALPPY